MRNQIKSLSREQIDTLALNIATVWFTNLDGKLEFDCELNSDHMAAVTDILTGSGIYPDI
ncbi:hypothetical protein AW736_01780 [Termitidicoccus mucosus]|uniref:Uncharacterized protein n=1 Tax=Termitidicoccus mucosus TaxID=1184151 RepID=A0A178IP87_9BACT|nr:hypothetical protein AW736_01780 [Opitutaceae bacterium TSB47]